MEASWRSLAWAMQPAGFLSDVDTCYREIFNFSIFSVTPQEPVQMDLLLLQPDMVIHLVQDVRTSVSISFKFRPLYLGTV